MGFATSITIYMLVKMKVKHPYITFHALLIIDLIMFN